MIKTKPCNADVEQAVARIYSAMLDNIALTEQRRWMRDLVNTGTAAMKFDNDIDARARHCAIHGCPYCKRTLIETRPLSWIEMRTERTRARARTALVLGLLAVLVVLYYLGRP